MNWLSKRRPPGHNADPYRDALAIWAEEHGADAHDLTPDQDERFRLRNRLVNAGIDLDAARFALWLREAGRIGEGE